MTQPLNHPKRKQIEVRNLNAQEYAWIQEILNFNSRWAKVDPGTTSVIAECDCGACRTVYLDSSPNHAFEGTKGYIGRIEIRTDNEFGITVTLDQLNGRLSELYVNALDLSDEGLRPFPERWEEVAHIVEPM